MKGKQNKVHIKPGLEARESNSWTGLGSGLGPGQSIKRDYIH